MTEARPIPDLCQYVGCGHPKKAHHESGSFLTGGPFCEDCEMADEMDEWDHSWLYAVPVSPALPEPPACEVCGFPDGNLRHSGWEVWVADPCDSDPLDGGCGITVRHTHHRFVSPTPPCLLCSREKPWGTRDPASGIAVCVDCRNAAERARHAPALPVEGDDSDRPTDTEIENAWHAAYYAWRTAQGYGNRLHSWHAGELAFAAGYRQARADERRASDELQRQADRTFTGYEQALARALASEERERGLRQAAIAVVATFDVLDARGVTLAQEGTVLGDSLSALRRALLIPENADEGQEG